MKLSRDFKEFVASLNANGVRHLVVGGYAVAMHGHPLQTADREVIESLRKKLERDQSRANRLLDEVADLNREKLEIDVPQNVIGIAGLPA